MGEVMNQEIRSALGQQLMKALDVIDEHDN